MIMSKNDENLFETNCEDKNSIYKPPTWRTYRDAWDDNKIKDKGSVSSTVPVPVDFVGRDYSTRFTMCDKDSIRRDALIESILSMDNAKKEYIRRLIIDESRLDVLMRLIGYRAPEHQLLLNRFLSGKKFGLVLAPRGSGKSTSCNMCYAVMRALQNRNIRVLIASRTVDQAKAFLSEIKFMLLNEKLQEIFGDLKGIKWDETQADINGKTVHKKEHTFTIAGADGTVVSKHFELIIGDDIVENKNSRTDGQRKQILKFFYTSMLPTLRPEGEMRILGTRYHPEDLYGYLISNDVSFKDNWFVLPVVYDKETAEPVDLIQDKNGKFHAPENATSYDPIGFPMKEIIRRRSGMPLSDFECQYQNRTSFIDGDYFKNEWFRHYDGDPFEIKDSLKLATWIGVDLASSLKDDADEFALVVIGILSNMKECYVLDYISGRFTFKEQFETVIRYYDIWSPIRVFVEGNAYQQVLASTVVQTFPDVRAVPVFTSKDKVTRARALQLYYERRQMFHRKGRMSKLEEQLVGFPNIKLKDLFDALFLAVNGSLQGGARKRRKPEEEFGLF